MSSITTDWDTFRKRYPTKIGKARALGKMSDAEIDKLASGIQNKTGQAVIASYKAKNKARRAK